MAWLWPGTGAVELFCRLSSIVGMGLSAAVAGVGLFCSSHSSELLYAADTGNDYNYHLEERSRVQGCLFSSIFCVTKTCYVAMPSGYKLVITRALGMHGTYCTQPSGYKLVITRALGMHGTYCTQPSGLTPSCFSAI